MFVSGPFVVLILYARDSAVTFNVRIQAAI